MELRIYRKISDIIPGSLYLPGFSPKDHKGKYVIINIDIASGKINNWTPPKL